jgi:hypothetical protein
MALHAIGLPDRNRTCDPQLRRLLLYPTELRADEMQKQKRPKWAFDAKCPRGS